MFNLVILSEAKYLVQEIFLLRLRLATRWVVCFRKLKMTIKAPSLAEGFGGGYLATALNLNTFYA